MKAKGESGLFQRQIITHLQYLLTTMFREF